MMARDYKLHFFDFAHRLRWATAILARASGETIRFFLPRFTGDSGVTPRWLCGAFGVLPLLVEGGFGVMAEG